MKWKAPVTELFVLVFALALEKTLKPSTTLSIVLFAIAGLAGATLLASLIWNSEWLWKRVARKVGPQLSTAGPTPALGTAQDAEGSSPPEVLGSTREKREAAYDAILSTSEPYINAHREVDALSESNVYPPDLEEAEVARDLANVAYVAARQRVEQYGVKPVLDAALHIEDAVNRGDYDQAATERRDQLVPAVRKDMNRPTAAFF